MLITILKLFSEFLSFIFFGQIWSQELKFSKVTEIWYKGTFLYAYYGFNVYFFKILSIHIFWANLVKIRYKDRLLYAYFGFNISFFKIFVIHIFLGIIGAKI